MALHGETGSNIDQNRVPGLGSIFIVLLLQALLVYLWLLLAFDLVVKFSVKSTHNHEENWRTCHSIINETSNKFKLTPLKKKIFQNDLIHQMYIFHCDFCVYDSKKGSKVRRDNITLAYSS